MGGVLHRWTGPGNRQNGLKNVSGKTRVEVKEKLKQAIQKNTEVDTLKAAQYIVGQWMDIWFENYYFRI